MHSNSGYFTSTVVRVNFPRWSTGYVPYVPSNFCNLKVERPIAKISALKKENISILDDSFSAYSQ